MTPEEEELLLELELLGEELPLLEELLLDDELLLEEDFGTDPDDELLEEEELELEELLDDELDDDEPFKISAPCCGGDIKEVPSILVPGEYLPRAFKNLSCALSKLKLKSPVLFNEIP